MKVVTISSWLNFGSPAPLGRGSAAGENFWLRLTTASAQCLHLSLWVLFSFFIVYFVYHFITTNVRSHRKKTLWGLGRLDCRNGGHGNGIPTRCSFNSSFRRWSFLHLTVKNYGNWSTVAEVIMKINIDLLFWDTVCNIHMHRGSLRVHSPPINASRFVYNQNYSLIIVN